MNFLKNKEIPRDQWMELLISSPFSSPFQSPEYYTFINSINDFKAEVYAVAQKSKLTGLIVVTIQKEKGVKGYFSRRGIIYGGPLLTGSGKKDAEYLLKNTVKLLKKKVIYIEFRNYFDYSAFKTEFINNKFDYQPWLNYHLDTSDESQMIARVSSSRMLQIRKALKAGVKVTEAESVEDVITFFKILSNLYKKRVRKPLPDQEFFIEFYRQGIGKFFLVKYQDKIIGGIMCPIYKHKAIYELYVCGLDTEYRDQYPSVMATWAAMDYALKNKIPIFDFMGAGSPEKNYGVREFKARFGGNLVEYGRFVHITNHLLFFIGKAVLDVLSKIR